MDVDESSPLPISRYSRLALPAMPTRFAARTAQTTDRQTTAHGPAARGKRPAPVCTSAGSDAECTASSGTHETLAQPESHATTANQRPDAT